MSLILQEKINHTVILTLNRPEALNALNKELLIELNKKIDEIIDDDTVYVTIITGAGKSFVAGADIASMKDMNSLEGLKFGKFGNNIFLKLEMMEKPVVAAINGFALGGGCELAMACDIRIASDRAKFGQPEVSLGITPGFGGTQRLPRIVGASKAKELIFTGDIIKADEALKIGLVNAVYNSETLIEEALKLAEKIGKNAQIAVRQSKKAIHYGLQTDMITGIGYESEAFGICFATEDQKNAMEAFVSKEKLDEFKNK